jgi:hypothetical protein
MSVSGQGLKRGSEGPAADAKELSKEGQVSTIVVKHGKREACGHYLAFCRLKVCFLGRRGQTLTQWPPGGTT